MDRKDVDLSNIGNFDIFLNSILSDPHTETRLSGSGFWFLFVRVWSEAFPQPENYHLIVKDVTL